MIPKVSIIIPVYNVEKYLDECLRSVVNQSLDDIQVILVNDGSKDRSADICKTYAERYSNFEYYYQENSGSAAARNKGLDYAKGEYVGFIDADDWVEKTMYERMYHVAKKFNDVDMVFCRCFEDECPGSYEYIFPEYGYYDRDKIEKCLFPDTFPRVTAKGTFRSIRWCNWLRLYRREVIEKYHIRSCEGVSNCEDLGFNTEFLLHADSFYYLNERLYHNRPNPSSQSRNYVVNMWKRTKKLIKDMDRYVSECHNPAIQSSFQVCIFFFITMTVRNEFRLNNRKERIRNYKCLISDPLCKNTLNMVTVKGMNKEYAGILNVLRKGSAVKMDRYMRYWRFKKNKLYPALIKVIHLPIVYRCYKFCRGRK